MKYIVSLLSILLSISLSADDCISFEGVKKSNIVQPIISELARLGVNSKINVGHGCKFKIYLPIDVYIENHSGVRDIEIYLTFRTDNNPLEAKVLQISDINNEFYDLARNGKKVKNILIKKHSKIIAQSIKNELF